MIFNYLCKKFITFESYNQKLSIMDNYIQLALIGLIFGIIGYLIGKISTGKPRETLNEKWKLELENYKQKNTSLLEELNRLKLESANKINNFASSNESETPIKFDPSIAESILGKNIKEDDLKIVEGIGPKIEELFKTSGILTWKAMSELSVDRLREILSKAGERYHIHDPGTWPKQSRLAYEGKWQQLKDWQTTLDGGREV